MISLTKFLLPILVIASEITFVVIAAMKVMQQYNRVDDGLIEFADVSLIGNGSTCSPGQCASSCNSQGNICDGFMLTAYDDDDSMKMVMCQLVKVKKSVTQIVVSRSDRQRLYLRKDVWSNIMLAIVQGNRYTGKCSFPFTYRGQLYNNCTTNVTSVNSYICFGVNRTGVQCDDPSYVAPTVPMNLTVANQSIVTTMSVFGWIMLQLRTPVSTSFNWARSWSEYKNGFGSISTNYWLGLERVNRLTSSGKYRLRIEMQATSSRAWYSVEYWSFVIGNETATKYQLNVNGYSGDGGNGLQYTGMTGWLHNGMNFSTTDSDNDQAPHNCAAQYAGGWWYKNCHYVCLTCAGNNFKCDSIPVSTDRILVATRMMIKPQ